jgi:hypothetical protein
MRQLLILVTLSLTIFISPPALAAYQKILSTPTQLIVIVVKCPEGDLECSDVAYVGVDRASGTVTELTGSDWIRRCTSQNTPCQHVGFKFVSGETLLFISDDGTVTRQSTKGDIFTSERGKWLDL